MPTPIETERTVRRLGNDVDSIYEILTDHGNKLDALSDEIGSLRTEHGAKLDSHSATLDSHGAKLDAHSATLADHGAKLDVLVATQVEILELLRNK